MERSEATWDTLWTEVRLATLAAGADGADRGDSGDDGGAPAPGESGDGYGLVHDGALAVRDGRIAWVGSAAELPAGAEARARSVRRGEGRLLTPGLVDCHTHLVFAGTRADEFEARLKGATYEEIARGGGGILSTVRATREASEEELVRIATPRVEALLSEGVTTLEIKSGYGLDPESELRMLRAGRALGRRLPVDIRTTLLAAHALPPEYEGRRAAYVDLVVEEILPQAVDEGLVDAVDAFLESIAFLPEEVDRIFSAAAEMGLPVRLHADQLGDGGGAALAARHRALSADHLEHASLKGVEAMGEAGTVAVLLPGAFYFLGESKRPPVDAFREHGVPMALATDLNPGSSPARSLLLMLNMGCTLFGLTPAEALAAVTRNGARAMGLEGDRGTLEVGKRADLALWDVGHPGELAYWIGGNPLVERILAGETVPE